MESETEIQTDIVVETVPETETVVETPTATETDRSRDMNRDGETEELVSESAEWAGGCSGQACAKSSTGLASNRQSISLG